MITQIGDFKIQLYHTYLLSSISHWASPYPNQADGGAMQIVQLTSKAKKRSE